jgi:glyoxylase-like metal-dependent hydrolase (beta-lactamase superfamily II)
LVVGSSPTAGATNYVGDQWLDRAGEGYRVSPHVWLMPGHTTEDLTVVVETDGGVIACTHAWWHTDRTPEVDPLAEAQAALEVSRQRILASADREMPGLGEPFETRRQR